MQHQIRKSLERLAGSLKGNLPDRGPFSPIRVDVAGLPDRTNKVRFEVGPYIDDGEPGRESLRFFAVQVLSPSGEGHASQWLFSGTNDAVLDFLRNKAAVLMIKKAIQELTESANDLV